MNTYCKKTYHYSKHDLKEIFCTGFEKNGNVK